MNERIANWSLRARDWLGRNRTMVVGFGAGVLLGTALLYGRNDSAASDTPAQAPPTAVATPAQTESPLEAVANDPESIRLQHEIDVLRAKLDQERVRRELEEFRRETADSPSRGASSRSRGEEETSRRESAAGEDDSREGRATLAYWNRLNNVISEEAAMRSIPEGGVDASNAQGFLERRIAAGKFSAEAIDALDSSGVDSDVVSLAHDLAQWYRDGAAVAEHGKKLLSSDPSNRRGSPGQQYQASERQHAASVDALNSRGAAVRKSLTSKYGLDFPELR